MADVVGSGDSPRGRDICEQRSECKFPISTLSQRWVVHPVAGVHPLLAHVALTCKRNPVEGMIEISIARLKRVG